MKCSMLLLRGFVPTNVSETVEFTLRLERMYAGKEYVASIPLDIAFPSVRAVSPQTRHSMGEQEFFAASCRGKRIH